MIVKSPGKICVSLFPMACDLCTVYFHGGPFIGQHDCLHIIDNIRERKENFGDTKRKPSRKTNRCLRENW